jgi:hypothetical protein
MTKKERKIALIIGAILLVAVLAIVGILALNVMGNNKNNPSASPSGPVVTPMPTGTPLALPSDQIANVGATEIINGSSCDGKPASGISVKASLTLVIGGNTLKPFPNLGVSASCSYQLHVDKDGNVIFNGPATTTHTLGDLLTFWRLKEGTDPALNTWTENIVNGSITINGKAYSGHWQQIIFNDGDKIVVTGK